MRFGKMKGKILVKKDDFRGDFLLLRGLDLVWDSATPPTHIWERSPKKTFLFCTFPKTVQCLSSVCVSLSMNVKIFLGSQKGSQFIVYTPHTESH